MFDWAASTTTGASATGRFSMGGGALKTSNFAAAFMSKGLPAPAVSPVAASFASWRAAFVPACPEAVPRDFFFSDSLITAIRSFDSRDRFAGFTAGRTEGAADAACLRTSERRATLRLKAANSAAAAPLPAAGFCAACVSDSTVLRAAVAGLTALRGETLSAGVFFGAAACLPRAGLPVATSLTASTGFVAKARLAAGARASVSFPLRAAAAVFFAVLAVEFPDAEARVDAGALVLAAGEVARELTAATVFVFVFTVVFVFTFCTDFLVASFLVAGFLLTRFLAASFLAASLLAASTRAAAACLALALAARLDAFAFGFRVRGCFACFVSDDFIVFLTDAITSALLFTVPLWRRDGSSTAYELSAVRKL